jgi:site-specific DNA-cytosine methylase
MTNNKIKVLSLFDGIAGCRQALKELNIDCDYYASEIDKYAIKVANHNHPDIVQIGDVKSCDFKQFKDIDLLSAGFPCQSYSMAGNRKCIEDERGQLI